MNMNSYIHSGTSLLRTFSSLLIFTDAADYMLNPRLPGADSPSWSPLIGFFVTHSEWHASLYALLFNLFPLTSGHLLASRDFCHDLSWIPQWLSLIIPGVNIALLQAQHSGCLNRISESSHLTFLTFWIFLFGVFYIWVVIQSYGSCFLRPSFVL